MARNYDFHLLTLAQVPNLLRVEGSWPGPLELRAGWFRARARPWNDSVPDPMIRLERGGAEFLITVSRKLFELGASAAYSPALYPGSTGVWRRSGFEDHAHLDIMERSLGNASSSTEPDFVREEPEPNWDSILDVDRAAFEGFWGMSRLGLQEALGTSRSNVLLVAEDAGHLLGYAIVGSQWGAVYLHRIAVRREDTGRGFGTALLTASLDWGARSGARSMVLNVRPENRRAKRLYKRHGFSDTGTALQVLRQVA